VSGTVLSVSSRALLEACARFGLDTTRILRAARLDGAVLRDPDARIPAEQVDALWREACALSNDPNLAQSDIAASEVAYLLGFAQQSSFNHAFKRWSGETPTSYRRRLLGTRTSTPIVVE